MVSGSPTESACLGWGLKVRMPCGAECFCLTLRLPKETIAVTYMSEFSPGHLRCLDSNTSFCLHVNQLGMDFKQLRQATRILHVETFNSTKKRAGVVFKV